MKHLEFYAGKQTLVTGGLGFVGSNLAMRLLELGAQVVVVDAAIAETGANVFNIESVRDHPRLSVRTVDVRDTLAMDRLVRNREVIFNLAGQVSHIDSMQDPFTDLEINCRSHKLAGERYHVLYNNVYGIRTSVLRLTNTYGPRMLVKNNRQTAIGWLIRQAMDGEDIAIFGDGSQLRDFTYVDDVVDAFLIAGANDAANGQVFNVGGIEPISLRDVAELLVETAGTGSFHLVPFPPERKAIDVGSIYVDDRKIRRVLRWRPSVEMREGLTRTIDFYKEHREHYWATSSAMAAI